MQQVLTNLLVNAIESLNAEAGEVLVRVSRSGNHWLLEVQDNGHGIPEAFLHDQLFHPFRSTKEGGLGIGLYQCKSIVESVGGTISVASTENVGTTISILLPILTPTEEAAIPSKKAQILTSQPDKTPPL